jgi:predicted nucleic-acid-binding protein
VARLKALDTNVLIRYLVQDDVNQSALATDFIENHCTDSAPCFIGHITLCEVAWVLESNYGQNRTAIAKIIEQLLHVGQLEVMGSSIVWQALNDYKSSNADFPDHLLARVNQSVGCETTVTLDKKASKQTGFELLK